MDIENATRRNRKANHIPSVIQVAVYQIYLVYLENVPGNSNDQQSRPAIHMPGMAEIEKESDQTWVNAATINFIDSGIRSNAAIYKLLFQ